MIIAANWKMNIGFKQAEDFLIQFKKHINQKQDLDNFIFFPPAYLAGLFQKESLHWGGQNIYHKAKGSFTGETSAQTLKEMGAEFCLVGHSERRWTFGESDVDVEKKFSLMQELALIPVLCVGENLTDRMDKEKTLKTQLSWIKKYTKYDDLPWKPELISETFKRLPFIVAYEPVWSIGTGNTPSSGEIEDTAQFIKEYLQFPEMKVFYGGSVDKNNIRDFSIMTSTDGFLVGRASVNPEELCDIYQQIREN